MFEKSQNSNGFEIPKSLAINENKILIDIPTIKDLMLKTKKYNKFLNHCNGTFVVKTGPYFPMSSVAEPKIIQII